MAIVNEGMLLCPGCREYVVCANPDQYPDGVDYETPGADTSPTKCRPCRVHEDGSEEECDPDCGDCAQNTDAQDADGTREEDYDCEDCYLGTGYEEPEKKTLLLVQDRKSGSVFWFNTCTVDLVDRITGDVVATGPGFEPFSRTLILPKKRYTVTVTDIPWSDYTAEVMGLAEIQRSDGTSARYDLAYVGLALRYTSGPQTGVLYDRVQSYWTAHDAMTGRELIPGKDIVHDRMRGNRPATVMTMSSLGHFQVRYEDDEQLTHHLGACRLDPADYGVTTKKWNVDIELGRG
jgi:hypothetical protein